jgi:aryl-alcohol dehydrogenase-like predicted oxidoreductase
MNLRKLGQSELQITPIGIGSWALGGGKWEFAWGAPDDRESVIAIHAGLERGINWIDTAAVYGLGHSEEVVGRAVRGLSKRPYVFTKCSLVWDESGTISHNLQASSIRREAEASLKRLGLDAIDLIQIHWPAWKGNPESASPGSIEEAVGELAKLQAEGKIRNIGVSNFNAQQMARAIRVATIASLQPPYSLLATEVEESTLPFAMEHQIGVIVYSPMASGLLSGAMTRERIAAETLRAVGQRYNVTPGTVAIAWTLRNPAVTGAIVGVRRAQQVDGVIGAASIELNNSDLLEIEHVMALQAA